MAVCHEIFLRGALCSNFSVRRIRDISNGTNDDGPSDAFGVSTSTAHLDSKYIEKTAIFKQSQLIQRTRMDHKNSEKPTNKVFGRAFFQKGRKGETHGKKNEEKERRKTGR